ncbi:MAG: hypothetical protein ACE5JJ_03155 [Nitrospinota bacterium]
MGVDFQFVADEVVRMYHDRKAFVARVHDEARQARAERKRYVADLISGFKGESAERAASWKQAAAKMSRK